MKKLLTITVMTAAFIAVQKTDAQVAGTPYIVPQKKETSLPPEEVGDIGTSQYRWVGAFWKWNQKGERLIRFRNTGTWKAEVLNNNNGLNWIRLDKTMTSDPNVGWRTGANEAQVVSGNDAGFENAYPVNSTLTTVTGNGNIYFRIGLTGSAPGGSDDHRYGVVQLTISNNDIHYIYIRQGEAADVLYPNRIPTPSAAFSAYNVTAPNLGNGGTNLANHPVLSQAGVFTAYPSQAGAYFIWNDTRAFHPTNPGGGAGGITGWPTTYASTWNTNNDVCPSGYRVPVDGPLPPSGGQEYDGNNPNQSEMRQSLYAVPKVGDGVDYSSFTYGYYADGFFDRRKIVSYGGSGAPVAVSTVANSINNVNNTNIAYAGVLFFNPTTYASLFFPAAGDRVGTSSSNGALAGTGNIGYYWSRTTDQNQGGTSNPNAWIMYPTGNGATSGAQVSQHSADKHYGASLRCVVGSKTP
ncbi:MAG: hypothetical protein LBE91_00415 [Tannerella sp.]|jgi:hypothetical protein|nr:hypothetical protein [Tannerella sp.]